MSDIDVQSGFSLRLANPDTEPWDMKAGCWPAHGVFLLEPQKDGNRKMGRLVLRVEDNLFEAGVYVRRTVDIFNLPVVQLLALRQQIDDVLIKNPCAEEVQRIRTLNILDEQGRRMENERKEQEGGLAQ